jgi:hypothetical protein
MAYPSQHRFPDGVPLWALAGHTLSTGDGVEVTEYEQGEDRHREVFTFKPWLASVATKWLTQAQFDAFDAWFGSELEAGARNFDCPLHSLEGVGVQWWEAKFVGPYRWEARSARYRITAELIMLDGPYAGGTGPGTVGDTRIAPSLGASSIASSNANAIFAAAAFGAWSVAESEATVTLDNSLGGASSAEGSGQGFMGFSAYLLLPDGGYFLLPDGGRLGIDY